MINSEGALDTPYAKDPASIFGGRPSAFMQGGVPGRRSEDAQEFCRGDLRNGGRALSRKNEWPPNSPDLLLGASAGICEQREAQE